MPDHGGDAGAFEAKHRLRSTLQHTATRRREGGASGRLSVFSAGGRTTGELLHVDGGLVETMA